MMVEMKKNNELDKFQFIVESALITKKRTKEFLEVLKAIIEFEAKLHYDNNNTIFELEKAAVNKDVPKKPRNEVESNSQEMALTYLPYWDVRISGKGTDDDGRKIQGWFNLTKDEASNICKQLNCFTIRDFIQYYRANQRVFSQHDFRELEIKKKIPEVKLNQFNKMIVFLSGQWLAFPHEVGAIISLRSVKIKLDLSQVKLETPESLQAIVVAYFNCNNILRRMDFSGTRLIQDISHVVNQVLAKQERDHQKRLLDREAVIADCEKYDKPIPPPENYEQYFLEELCVSCNSFGQKGMDQIMQSHGRSIKSFGFDKCGLKINTMTSFRGFVLQMKDLRVLSLEFNNVGDEGIRPVFESLKFSKQLIYLNVSDNLLTASIVPTIVAFLKVNEALEALECERNAFVDNAASEITSCLQANPKSQLRLLKLGNFKATRLDLAKDFNVDLQNAPNFAVASFTVGAKNTSEHIYAYLPKNRGMISVKYYPSYKRLNNHQSIIRHFYNELALLENTSMLDLLQMYRPRIEDFDSTYFVKVPYRLFKIWVKGKNVDLTYRYIEKESKISLLARYLISLAIEQYKDSDVIELFQMVDKRLMRENPAFTDGLRLIHKIILVGNLDYFKTFLTLNYDLTLLTEKGDKFIPQMTGLHLILMMERWDLLDAVLEKRDRDQRNPSPSNIFIPLDVVDEYSNSMLHYVSLYNNYTVLEKLLAQQTNIQQKNFEGDEALHVSVYNDSYECFLALLNKYGRQETHEENIINKRNNKGENCLQMAINNRASKIFAYCLSVMKKFDYPDADKLYPIHHIINSNNFEFLEVFLARKPPLRMPHEQNENPMFYCLWQNKPLYFLKRLLRYHDEDYIAQKNRQGMSLLHVAVKQKNLPAVQLLLEYNLNPSEEDDQKNSPLFYAKEAGLDDILRTLQGRN